MLNSFPRLALKKKVLQTCHFLGDLVDQVFCHVVFPLNTGAVDMEVSYFIVVENVSCLVHVWQQVWYLNAGPSFVIFSPFRCRHRQFLCHYRFLACCCSSTCKFGHHWSSDRPRGRQDIGAALLLLAAAAASQVDAIWVMRMTLD